MLTVTGRNMDWKIVFEVDVAATYSLYVPHVSSFVSLLISYLLLGCTLWSMVHRYIQTHNDSPCGHFRILRVLVSSLILVYVSIIIFYGLPPGYKNLSSNMALTYFPEALVYYWRRLVFMSLYTSDAVLNAVTQAVRAPAANLSHPLTSLKKPIKHVFLIILESTRADVLPLNESLAKAVRSTFTSEGIAAQVTPFLSSFAANSVRMIASSTSSYTLKSLVSIFCGIYPIAANFLKEIMDGNRLYQACLPELLRDTFRTRNNQSAFRSAIFTSARGDFDHQRNLFMKFKFDTLSDASDIYNHVGYLPDVGMFGPADHYTLPTLWRWLDNTLVEDETIQLFMSMLVTGTHEPFSLPDDFPADDYRYYIDHPYANAFLNALRISDQLVEQVIHGFKSRKLYDQTLFIVVSDHGYVFNDHGSQIRGLLSNPLEPAFSVPLMFHNPSLKAKQLTGRFSTMDILPTTMDILLSSTARVKKSANRLSFVRRKELESILSQYEGTSMLRKPGAGQSERMTFSLANPGNAFVIARQYPNKLSYDVENDEVHLYHLGRDPFELTDLLALDYSDVGTHPSWLNVKQGENLIRVWKGRWLTEAISISVFRRILSESRNTWSSAKSNGSMAARVNLNEMLDWAEQTFEVMRLWVRLMKKRYHKHIA